MLQISFMNKLFPISRPDHKNARNYLSEATFAHGASQALKKLEINLWGNFCQTPRQGSQNPRNERSVIVFAQIPGWPSSKVLFEITFATLHSQGSEILEIGSLM